MESWTPPPAPEVQLESRGTGKGWSSWRESRKPGDLQLGEERGRGANLAKSCGCLSLPWHRNLGRGAVLAMESGGEPWALAVFLVQLMEPISIQDAEDIIDLNKLSVKEKL